MSTPPEAPPKPASLATRIAKAPWRLIGIVLLIIVLLNIDLKQLLSSFTHIGPGFAVAAAGAFVLLVAARCWRWHVLAHAAGSRQRFLESTASCNRSIWLGLVTPGRLGEFRRAADLSVGREWGLAASGGLVLFDLLIDFGAYATLGACGFLYLFLPEPWGAVSAFAVAAAAISVVLGLGALAGLTGRWAPALLHIPGFDVVLPAMREGLRGQCAIQVLLATLLSLGSFATMMICLIEPIGLDLGFAVTIATIGLASVAGALPITYFGLGTREAALIWFLGIRGVTASDAVAVSFTYLIATVIGIAVSLGLDLLVFGHMQRREIKNDV